MLDLSNESIARINIFLGPTSMNAWKMKSPPKNNEIVGK